MSRFNRILMSDYTVLQVSSNKFYEYPYTGTELIDVDSQTCRKFTALSTVVRRNLK